MKRFIMMLSVILLFCILAIFCHADTLYIDKYPALNCDTLAEYEAEMQKYHLCAEFVEYAEISVLGEFIGFETYPWVSYNDEMACFMEYWYYLRDERGVELTFAVSDRYGAYYGILPNRIPVDLRMNEEGATQRSNDLHIGGLHYSYTEQGKLSSIDGRTNNFYYSIYSTKDAELYEYPQEGADTFMARLLNGETAEDAARELRARIDGSYVEPKEEGAFPWLVVGAIGGGVVAMALVATVSSLVTVKVMQKKAKRKEEDTDGDGGNGSNGGDGGNDGTGGGGSNGGNGSNGGDGGSDALSSSAPPDDKSNE